jgi:glycosyltransferase involved in cell wall biosynthesis
LERKSKVDSRDDKGGYVEMSCDIIIPVWDQLKVTKECIESIMKNTHYPYNLIIIDNGSDRATAGYLDSLASETGIHLIRNKENRGFVKAINQGLGISKAPHVCIMNNDTIATDGWLRELVDVANLDKDIGLVNPSSNNLGQDKGADTTDSYALKLKGLKEQFIEMGSCIGFCMLIKREVIERIGDFDEAYNRGNFEETKGAYVYHHMRSSFLKFKDYDESFKRNQDIFNRRWGRPKRVLYIITKGHEKLSDWVSEEVINKARGGNWVWLFFKDKEDLPEIREHSNVKLIQIPPRLFEWNCIIRVLRKKKKFDSIYADDPELARKIKRYSSVHRAETMLMGG